MSSRPLVRPLPLAAAALLVAAGGLLSACGTGDASADVVRVAAGDDSCEVARTTLAAGDTTFAVSNVGASTTEFYVYEADGTAVVGEVENIGAGTSRDLTVVLDPGAYVTSCRPGMSGNGIRQQIDVTEDGSTSSAADDPELVAASAAYVTWVAGETDLLLDGTRQFAAAITAGDVEQAKALYAATRMHWERVEPVAESFGDLDPRMDARDGDLEEGVPWTGWHRLEQDLWVNGLQADSAAVAAQLVEDTEDLVNRVATLRLTADRVTNGAKELLDEVATGKITGEEDRYSHTDLWDFQANVEGAQQAYAVMAGVVKEKDPALATTLEQQFSALLGALQPYRVGDGFVLYTDLTEQQIKDLSVRIEALSEPLSQLTATVLG